MGILNKLTTEGSAFTAYNGASPQVNPLATQQSKLHSDGGAPGYSLNGDFANTVSIQSNDYLDGVNNPLPLPSQLDLNGIPPAKYLDNLPE